MAEYAKILRWTKSDAVYGLKTNIQLPSSASVGTTGGFINFYLGVYGSNTNYECGLSTNYTEALNGKWHWFWNTGAANDGGAFNLAAGSTVPIELSVNSSNKLDFKVNGTVVKTFSGATGTFGSLTSARLVVEACDRSFTTIPNPLPNWNTLHNQVVCSGISFRNSAGAWTVLSSANSTPPSSTTFWPDGYAHTGTPADYTKVVSTGQLIASLKR
ncbi:hypothetical protein YDYSY3_05800 [Paenibacillus chitinolyticus]|uniref:hypothetical protein n=1 Tax=Paenibacillus chitinolyticus TaxID=79263 RepID=UPI0026E4E629|nr:hypothetical protein [Paenibacillus chitinolyticus]GKS09580.1 hypothetical protein YDYSY3_05800 [Paenibacillus chitinolyticus]